MLLNSIMLVRHQPCVRNSAALYCMKQNGLKMDYSRNLKDCFCLHNQPISAPKLLYRGIGIGVKRSLTSWAAIYLSYVARWVVENKVTSV